MKGRGCCGADGGCGRKKFSESGTVMYCCPLETVETVGVLCWKKLYAWGALGVSWKYGG